MSAALIAKLREQAQRVEDQLTAMAKAHKDGHDPCDCVSKHCKTECLQFVARRRQVADRLEKEGEPELDGLALLEQRYGQ